MLTSFIDHRSAFNEPTDKSSCGSCHEHDDRNSFMEASAQPKKSEQKAEMNEVRFEEDNKSGPLFGDNITASIAAKQKAKSKRKNSGIHDAKSRQTHPSLKKMVNAKSNIKRKSDHHCSKKTEPKRMKSSSKEELTAKKLKGKHASTQVSTSSKSRIAPDSSKMKLKNANKKFTAKSQEQSSVFNPFDLLECMNDRANRPLMSCDMTDLCIPFQKDSEAEVEL